MKRGSLISASPRQPGQSRPGKVFAPDVLIVPEIYHAVTFDSGV